MRGECSGPPSRREPANSIRRRGKWLPAGFGVFLLCGVSLVYADDVSVRTVCGQDWELSLLAAYRMKQTGDYAGAEKILTQVLRDSEKAWQGDRRYAVALHGLALVNHDLGNYLRAEALYIRAAGLFEVAGREYAAQRAASLNGLASCYSDSGQFAKAQRVLGHPVDTLAASLGPKHPEVARMFNNRGVAYAGDGKYSSAESAFREALERMAENPDAMPDFEAMVRNNLGATYVRTGHYAEARPQFERALALVQREPVSDGRGLIAVLSNFAGVCLLERRWVEGEAFLKRAMSVAETRLDVPPPAVAHLLITYSALLRAMHRKGEAAGAEKRAKALLASGGGQAPGRYMIDVADLTRMKGPGK